MPDKYKALMDFVEKLLKDTHTDEGRTQSFRSRSDHTRRVFRWAERLCGRTQGVDRDVLFTAAVFHDAGYSVPESDRHQTESERIFREYAADNGFDSDFTEKVALCVGTHSDKELLKTPDKLTIEQILLMEADLLDEEGAMLIARYALACGYKGNSSYEKVLSRITEESDGKEENPMVTEYAKELWAAKDNYVREFIRLLQYDLEM